MFILFLVRFLFWEIAAHKVDHMFTLYFDYLLYYLFPVLGFKDWSWVLIASVPDLCIIVTFILLSYL